MVDRILRDVENSNTVALGTQPDPPDPLIFERTWQETSRTISTFSPDIARAVSRRAQGGPPQPSVGGAGSTNSPGRTENRMRSSRPASPTRYPRSKPSRRKPRRSSTFAERGLSGCTSPCIRSIPRTFQSSTRRATPPHESLSRDLAPPRRAGTPASPSAKSSGSGRRMSHEPSTSSSFASTMANAIARPACLASSAHASRRALPPPCCLPVPPSISRSPRLDPTPP